MFTIDRSITLFSAKRRKKNKKWIELLSYYNASRNFKYIITALLEGLNTQMLNILEVLVYFQKKKICGKMQQKKIMERNVKKTESRIKKPKMLPF